MAPTPQVPQVRTPRPPLAGRPFSCRLASFVAAFCHILVFCTSIVTKTRMWQKIRGKIAISFCFLQFLPKKRGCSKNKAPELPHPRKRDTGCQKNEDMANARPGIATSSFLRPIATELGCSSQWAGLLWARGARFITTCSGLWGLVASSVIVSPNGYDFHPARNAAARGPSNSQRGITWMRQTPSFRWTARPATWPK